MQTPGPYSLCAVMQCPDGVVEVDAISERVTKRGPLGDGRCDRRLEEVHGVVILVPRKLSEKVAVLLRANEYRP